MLETINHGSRTHVHDATQKLLKNVIDRSARFSIVSLNRQIEVCEKLLVRNPPTDVTFVGQFEAGVDSFINSLRIRTSLHIVAKSRCRVQENTPVQHVVPDKRLPRLTRRCPEGGLSICAL
jgi:hypothetical protein